MTHDAKKETARVFISGLVQGVSYRRWLQQEAHKRDISGWTRNLRDGRVEAILHGEHTAVQDLVRACRHGPALSRVDRVTSEAAEYDGLEGFRIESTA